PGAQQTLWEMATAEGMEDRLRFTGVREDVARLMDAIDVITLPSVIEACSMAIIEAMSMGKPVIATRAGGNVELIDDQVTGLLVERTPEALAIAIVRLLRDRPARLLMGKADRERALSLFSARPTAKNMHFLYTSLLPSRSGNLLPHPPP